MPLPRTPLHSQAISAAQCEPKETLWPRSCNVASRAYPLSSLQCTSAFSANSAIAVSVCPFNDAKCSAINLHCRDALIRPLAICTARPFPQRRLPLARSPADPVGRPNPVLSLLCTTLASAAISTFTVSVCPLSEARCSAVHLQCKCTPPRVGNAEPSPPPATFFERRTHKQCQ